MVEENAVAEARRSREDLKRIDTMLPPGMAGERYPTGWRATPIVEATRVYSAATGGVVRGR